MPMRPGSDVHVLGALALELAPGSDAPATLLSQRDAGELAGWIARDLCGFAPEAAQLELVTVGAHYDAVELLRPGWPLHRELDQLAAQERFGLRIEHARHLTVHDLAAMMALQYEHAGAGALWPILEAALLAPDSEQWLDAPPEPLLHYVDGEARIALFSPAGWRARYAAADTDDGDRLERRFEQFQARQRQFAAVLGAHGIPVTFAHCTANAVDDL